MEKDQVIYATMNKIIVKRMDSWQINEYAFSLKDVLEEMLILNDGSCCRLYPSCQLYEDLKSLMEEAVGNLIKKEIDDEQKRRRY